MRIIPIISFDQTFLSPLIKGGRGVVKRIVWKKSLEEKFGKEGQ
jgi:hypothetical protein